MTIASTIHQTTADTEQRVRSEAHGVRYGLAEANERAIEYVKANPGTCLLGALAAGFVLGRIAGR